MTRTIDANALKAAIDSAWLPEMMVSEIWEVIDEMPTIDAVEVVRCKDCQYGHATQLLLETCWCCGLTGYFNTEDDYCGKGVKRCETG